MKEEITKTGLKIEETLPIKDNSIEEPEIKLNIPPPQDEVGSLKKKIEKLEKDKIKEKPIQTLLLILGITGIITSLITGVFSITGFSVVEEGFKQVSKSFIILIVSIILLVIYYVRKKYSK